MKTIKIKNILSILFFIIALLLLVDYSIEGNKTTEQVTSINKSHESYYNAAGNSHYSYELETKSFSFNISDNYYQLVTVGDQIDIYQSLFFKEINASKLIKKNYSETYSLRRLTGLLVPILLLIVSVLSYKFFDKIKILVFVTLIITIVNLVYLAVF